MTDESLDNPVLEPSIIMYGDSKSDNVDKAPEDPVAEVLEEVTKNEVEVKKEEQSENKEATDHGESEGSLVYQFGEREITHDQITEWEKGYLRQSDYTQKTMGVADKVKAETSKQVAERLGDIDEKASALKQHVESMESMIAEFESSVDLEELREDDYTEYQKAKETIDNRRAKIKLATEAAAKAADESIAVKRGEQFRLLIESTPEWSDDKGQATQKRDDDFKMIHDYSKDAGYTDAEFAQVGNHKTLLVFLEAAKYRQLKSKSTESKKVKQAPKLIKPTQSTGGKGRAETRSPEEIMYGKSA